MMANYQVLIVKEAQDMENIEELGGYIENPLTSTLLVICYKYEKIDKRKSFYKSIEKAGVLFESPTSLRQPDPGLDHCLFTGKELYNIRQSFLPACRIPGNWIFR